MSKHTPVSHDEASKILSRFNQSHWWPKTTHESRERARYTIPCDEQNDDDCKMLRYIEQNKARDNALAGMEPAALGKFVEAVEDVITWLESPPITKSDREHSRVSTDAVKSALAALKNGGAS